MAGISKNIILPTVELKTIKVTGSSVYSSNVTETLQTVSDTIGDVLWSVSSMTKKLTGGNSKKLVFLDSNRQVKSKNPQTGLVSLLKDLSLTEYAVPACLTEWDDFPVCIIGNKGESVDVRTHVGSGSINFANPFDVDATIESATYRCKDDVTQFSGAILFKAGTAYRLSFGSNSVSVRFKEFTPVNESSTFALYVNNSYVVLVETTDAGNTLVYIRSFSEDPSEPWSSVTMPTAGLTGKLCDIFAGSPIFYGYKDTGLYTGLYTVVGAASSQLNNKSISGIAVFTKYGTHSENGYIYRETTGECRDITGKRTDPITGTMVNDYNYIMVMQNEQNPTINPN